MLISHANPVVSIVDYGLGNILSVQRALEAVGATAVVADDASALVPRAPVVIPGVGSFAEAMQRLHQRGFPEAIVNLASEGVPVLGICLGMQLLLSYGEEGGGSAGLSLIPGRVIELPRVSQNALNLRLPSVGWRRVVADNGRSATSLRRALPASDEFYFVHSFEAMPDDRAVVCGEYQRGGVEVVAAVGVDRVWGVQFHPEKSGDAGLRFLRCFVEVSQAL